MHVQEISSFLKQKSYPTFQLKAVFFDMDGVLFDSMPAHAKAWVDAFKTYGMNFTAYEAYLNEGRTGNGTIDGVFLNQVGRTATDDEKKAIYQTKSRLFEQMEAAPVMPYALELLQKIKSQEIHILLVTGSGQPSLLDKLEASFPQIFEREKMVTAFDVKHGKPNPEPYLMALKKAQVEPWEAVVIENAPLGIASSVAAGIYTIAVNTGILADDILMEQGANAIFSGMKELYEQWNHFFHF